MLFKIRKFIMQIILIPVSLFINMGMIAPILGALDNKFHGGGIASVILFLSASFISIFFMWLKCRKTNETFPQAPLKGDDGEDRKSLQTPYCDKILLMGVLAVFLSFISLLLRCIALIMSFVALFVKPIVSNYSGYNVDYDVASGSIALHALFDFVILNRRKKCDEMNVD